jgi:hypothetical protein
MRDTVRLPDELAKHLDEIVILRIGHRREIYKKSRQ